MKRTKFQLNPSDREQLEQIVAKGELSVRVLKRALGLLALDRGETMLSVATHQQVNNNTVTSWRDRYLEVGVAGIFDNARSGRPVKLDGNQRAKITALACSKPPAGHGQWTLRLLADKIVELDYCESISHTQVAQILKKTK
jgi:putative transposase